MTYHLPTLIQVLTAFQIDSATLREITVCEGGLSGSEAWKVVGSQESFCLKLMPPEFSVNRLLSIHHAADQRRRLGMHYLAGFYPTVSGATYVEQGGRIWELQTWMEGTPPSKPVSETQKQAMFHAIAEFHALHETPPRQFAPSPGIQSRIERCEHWRRKLSQSPSSSLKLFGHPQWRSALKQFIDSFVQYESRLGPLLSMAEHEVYELDDCIADPRPDNFRFRGNELTGLFDLGSMRWDNIALDVARLASEVSVDGLIHWEFAFQAMATRRRLTPSEERLAILFDAANVLITGLNWVQWLAIDGIRFANCNQVSDRLSHLATRLGNIEKHVVWEL